MELSHHTKKAKESIVEGIENLARVKNSLINSRSNRRECLMGTFPDEVKPVRISNQVNSIETVLKVALDLIDNQLVSQVNDYLTELINTKMYSTEQNDYSMFSRQNNLDLTPQDNSYMVTPRRAGGIVSMFDSSGQKDIQQCYSEVNDEDDDYTISYKIEDRGDGEIEEQDESACSSKLKRGKYRKYSVDLKKKAIELARKSHDIMLAAKATGVPPKNLKRWLVSGPHRKKGGRRTQDPDMERQLFTWIKGYFASYNAFPQSRRIKEKALELSRFKSNFKASKGWLEKFMKRYGLTKKDRTTEFLNLKKEEFIDQIPDLRGYEESPTEELQLKKVTLNELYSSN